MDKEFKKWLQNTNQLDKYEAMLDISIDYTPENRSFRLETCNELDELNKKFKTYKDTER